MPERSYFTTPFRSQQVNGSETVLESARQHSCPNFSSMCDRLSWKLSLLVRSEGLRLFVNTLTAHHKYSRHNRENFLQAVQM